MTKTLLKSLIREMLLEFNTKGYAGFPMDRSYGGDSGSFSMGRQKTIGSATSPYTVDFFDDDEDEESSCEDDFYEDGPKKRSKVQKAFFDKIGSPKTSVNDPGAAGSRRELPRHAAPGMQHMPMINASKQLLALRILKEICNSCVSTSTSMSTVHNAYGQGNVNVVRGSGLGGIAFGNMTNRTKPGPKGGVGDAMYSRGTRHYFDETEDEDSESEEVSFSFKDIMNKLLSED